MNAGYQWYDNYHELVMSIGEELFIRKLKGSGLTKVRLRVKSVGLCSYCTILWGIFDQ